MNKLKSLFLLVLCLISIAGAESVGAQTGGDKVLVSGKNLLRQSDIDSLVKFYEWILEAEFTGEQRRRFQKYTENEFRSDPAGGRQTIDDISTLCRKSWLTTKMCSRKHGKTFSPLFSPPRAKIATKIREC